jgi:hypothetical protein
VSTSTIRVSGTVQFEADAEQGPPTLAGLITMFRAMRSEHGIPAEATANNVSIGPGSFPPYRWTVSIFWTAEVPR